MAIEVKRVTVVGGVEVAEDEEGNIFLDNTIIGLYNHEYLVKVLEKIFAAGKGDT